MPTVLRPSPLGGAIATLLALTLGLLQPGQALAQGSRYDWRRPGHVAAVGGVVYDPQCVPLRSAGVNVPNLPFRAGTAETLSWLRAHNQRWLRVFATGHALGPERAPRGQSGAAGALRALLREVEGFNAAVAPEERIYVLVALTDYYDPGVPGDRFAFDHPRYRGSPVLPAPWYRAGVARYDFVQEHGLGRLNGMPNYEVNFRPWVRALVSSVAHSPALMGWQLGNELKARGSPRNGVSTEQAYSWYLDFTRDIVDVIRDADPNHLIYTGAQYMAELVDWEYRPDGVPLPDLLPQYRAFVQQALDACGNACWNVWGLTHYDFDLYALDDAAVMQEAGVAVVLTEYGFTQGTAEESRRRYGGDRPAALRNGLARPWVDLAGQTAAPPLGAPGAAAAGPRRGDRLLGGPRPGARGGLRPRPPAGDHGGQRRGRAVAGLAGGGGLAGDAEPARRALPGLPGPRFALAPGAIWLARAGEPIQRPRRLGGT